MWKEVVVAYYKVALHLPIRKRSITSIRTAYHQITSLDRYRYTTLIGDHGVTHPLCTVRYHRLQVLVLKLHDERSRSTVSYVSLADSAGHLFISFFVSRFIYFDAVCPISAVFPVYWNTRVKKKRGQLPTMPRAVFITRWSAERRRDESVRIIRHASENRTTTLSHENKVYIKRFLYFRVLQVRVAAWNAVPTVNLALFPSRKPWYKLCSNNESRP
jgi:hypothetical protein